jgi:integrase
MPKKRLPENKGLPLRWKHQNGAYYYRVPVGMENLWEGKQTFKLGKSLHEAYKEWARRLEHLDRAETIGELLDRYSLEVVPTKQAATQTSDGKAIIKLRAVFGDMLIKHIKPQDIYGYYDARKAKSRGKRELQVLSHAYTKAVEWGLIDRHPFKGEVRIKGAKPRTRYIEDWELSEALKLTAPKPKSGVAMIQAYIKLKLLLGLRQGDMLRLKEADLTDDGINVTPHKTQNSSGKSIIYKWNSDLRLAIDEVRKTRPLDISKWLFCDRFGNPYIDESTGAAEGFSSMWQRFMARLLSETEIKVRFTEHDIRAKTASDAKSLEKAQELLAHTDSKITNRVYRRKPTEITLD